MFKHILVPLDLSNKHQAALRITGELAQQGNGRVVLLHVIEVIPGLDMEEEREFYQKLEKTARDHLSKQAEALGGRGIDCRPEIRYGARATEVARFAAEVKTDLIVLSAPVVDPAHPAAGLGSLSYKVGFLAHCPVLLVK